MSDDNRDYGVIVLEDGNPPAADYTPARKARVEIGFAYYPGNEGGAASAAEKASALAEQQLDRLLGRAPKTESRAAVEKIQAEVKTRKTKAEPAPPLAHDDPALDAVKAETAPAAEPAFDPTAVAAEPAGEVDFLTLDTPVAEITDADLNAACQKKVSDTGAPDKIIALINTFNPDPTRRFQLREIPMAQRQTFLDKLAELAKA